MVARGERSEPLEPVPGTTPQPRRGDPSVRVAPAGLRIDILTEFQRFAALTPGYRPSPPSGLSRDVPVCLWVDSLSPADAAMGGSHVFFGQSDVRMKDSDIVRCFYLIYLGLRGEPNLTPALEGYVEYLEGDFLNGVPGCMD